MKLKAKDTLFISSVKADNILPGETFEVSDQAGRDYIARGLATEVKGKAAPVPENKMEPAPANKAAPKRKAK